MELITVKFAQLISALFEKIGLFDTTPQWLIWALIITLYIVGFIIIFILITSGVIAFIKWIIEAINMKKGKKWKIQLYNELNSRKRITRPIKKTDSTMQQVKQGNFEDKMDDLFGV